MSVHKKACKSTNFFIWVYLSGCIEPYFVVIYLSLIYILCYSLFIYIYMQCVTMCCTTISKYIIVYSMGFFYSLPNWKCYNKVLIQAATLIQALERIKKNKKRKKNIIVFLWNSFIWPNRKGETKLYFLLMVVIKLSSRKQNILDEFFHPQHGYTLLISLFEQGPQTLNFLEHQRIQCLTLSLNNFHFI